MLHSGFATLFYRYTLLRSVPSVRHGPLYEYASLIGRHILQASGNPWPVVFEIQHDNIFIKINVIEISDGLEEPDDICLGNLHS